ncbi:MAG TPA: SHOCT domain-containing protein [Candidatus Dormibacteraeota bacterium]
MFTRPAFRGSGPGFHQVSEWQLVLATVLRFVAVLLVIAAAVYVARSFLQARAQTPHHTPPPPRSPGLDELDMRYARGEVTRSEYLERRGDLGGTAPPPPPPVA